MSSAQVTAITQQTEGASPQVEVTVENKRQKRCREWLVEWRLSLALWGGVAVVLLLYIIFMLILPAKG